MGALITFILFVIVSGFIINGFYEVTRHGRVFEFWSKFWEQFSQVSDEFPAVHKFPHWVRSPLSACVMCMSSVYGSIIFGLVWILEGENVFYDYLTIEIILIWCAFLLCLTCVNYIIHKQLK